MTLIMDGKSVAKETEEALKERVQRLKEEKGFIPTLATVLVGNDPASSVYVRNKKLMCEKVGIKSIDFNLDERISEEELLDIIINLNKDKTTNGILVQFPLPSHIDKQKIINTISPDKDVDGLHPINAGRLMNNVETLVPCTPQGCMIMLRTCLDDLSGKNAVVIGRSNLVGRPMCQLLTNSDCTVTQVHSKTINIEDFISQADILIAAIGIPKFVRAEWLKDRSVIIDVGINRISDNSEGNNKKKLVGDVDFDEAIKKVAAITPVPGGVGLMTVACLMRNTLIATTLQM